MKKSLIIPALLAAAAMAACSQKGSAPEFSTVNQSETLRFGENTFEIDYRFDYLSGLDNAGALKKIQNSMVSDFFGQDYLKETPDASAKAFYDAVVADFNNDLSDFQEAFPDAHPREWFLKIRSHNEVLNDKVAVYTIERAEYMGGAHGMETVEYSNYDLETGDRLTLDDLFSPEGKAALAGKIHEQILRDHARENWQQLMDNSCYFAKEEVLPTENFELSDTHITFMYNPYDIACYAQGRTKVKLALDGLAGFNAKAIGK